MVNCPQCGSPFDRPPVRGRPRLYCSSYCQQKAQRARKLVRRAADTVERSDKRVADWLQSCGL